MRLTNKITNTIALIFFVATTALIFSTCKPAIGTPWYPRSAASSSADFFITRIQVKGMDVVPVLADTPTDEADKIKKFSEAKNYTVNVPPEITEITAEDIDITAVASLSKMEAVTVEVTINGDCIPLSAGQVVPVTIKIADPAGSYTVQEKVLSITQREPYDLELKSLIVCGRDALQGNITVPYTVTAISAKDIAATFAYGPHTTTIPVELDKPSIKLYEDEEQEITISVKEKKGQYHAFSQTITVTRERRPDDADPVLEPESIFILGIRYEAGKPLGVPMDTEQITEADVVAVFKDFGDLPVTMTPNPAVFGSVGSIELTLSIPSQAGKYVGWETSITVKKDPTSLNNPKDKNGNKKYIVKVNTITEEVSPFDYYKEDYAGFLASKFDEWVLVMPSMSGIISSYKFQPGSWSGSPEMIDNIPSGIGSGFKAISNVKIYRYKTRADRWSASNGYVPAGDPNDSRFYFYRFTADASAGVKSDNSMFCVDRYSKFLFYYSDPAELQTIVPGQPPVPKDWTDYAAPSKGAHHQFGEPFYMSDPVGYVKADGSVVIYSWLKDNINNAKYHAQKNSAYTKPAGRSPGKAGYSPYRDNIIQKRPEVVKTVNPNYTVAMPIILGQPKAVRVPLNTAADNAYFMVKTAPAPDGEQLSYQWYTNTIQSNGGGTLIPGATSATYTPNTESETDCFVYCAVTNTNSSNSQTETVYSNAVKLLISNGSLAVDAEQPRIVTQPVGKVIPINTDGAVTLTVEAVSLDKGELSYQWYKNTTQSSEGGEAISGATNFTYEFTVTTSAVTTEYYYCKVTNTNNTVDGNKTAFICTEPAAVTVEESYKVTFSVDGGGYLTALHNGNSIESGTYVKKGEEVKFVVTLNPRHKVKEWVGVTPSMTSASDKVLAVLKVQDADAAVSVAIEPKMILTVTPKIYNESLQSWSTAGAADHANHKYIDGAHFAHDLSTKINANGDTSNKQWKYDFPVEGSGSGSWFGGGHGEYVKKNDFVKIGNYKEDANFVLAKNFSGFSEMNILFQTYLIKSNRLDYWRSEWTTSGGGPVYPKQPLDNNSIIKLVYNESAGKWSVDTDATNIQQPERVTISYPTDFTLADGEEKDFVITYTVNNNGYKAEDSYKDSDDGGENEASTRSKGTVKVIYTIGWK